MSTYVDRVIEVYTDEPISGVVEYNENDEYHVDNVQVNQIYYIEHMPWEIKKPKYIVWNGSSWDFIQKRKQTWQMLPLYYSNLSTEYAYTKFKDYVVFENGKQKLPIQRFKSIYNNGGNIRDYYLSSWGPYNYIINRGLAYDISEDAKEYINGHEYIYNQTYVTLSELLNISRIETEKFINKLKETQVNEKLDILQNYIIKIYNHTCNKKCSIKNINKEEDEYIDTIDSLLNEDSDELDIVMSIKYEINSIATLVDAVYGYMNSEHIRIHYFFS